MPIPSLLVNQALIKMQTNKQMNQETNEPF